MQPMDAMLSNPSNDAPAHVMLRVPAGQRQPHAPLARLLAIGLRVAGSPRVKVIGAFAGCTRRVGGRRMHAVYASWQLRRAAPLGFGNTDSQGHALGTGNHRMLASWIATILGIAARSRAILLLSGYRRSGSRFQMTDNSRLLAMLASSGSARKSK